MNLNKLRKHALLVLLVLGTNQAFCAQTGQKSKVERIYGQFCAQCHGSHMQGGNASALNDGTWLHGSTDEALTRAIHDGFPQLGMPGFGGTLSDENIRGLVVYMRERERAIERQQAPAPKPLEATPTATTHHRYRMQAVVNAGLSLPWSIEPLGNNRYIISERNGGLRIIHHDKVGKTIGGFPKVLAHGQGGMLDIAVHPEYEKNGWIYVSFSDDRTVNGNRKVLTAIVRGRIKNETWVDNEWISRFPIEQYTGAGHHFGCRIVLQNGYIYWTIGDRGRQNEAQNLRSANGNVFRLHDDGRIPDDNPFAKHPSALAQIYSFGHRNPQGLAWHPIHQELYSSEHGPRGGDELNWIQPGKNYGWPEITYGINYNGKPITAETHREGLEQPIKQFTPSPALCGMTVVTGDIFPKWNGDIFLGSLKAQELHRVRISQPQGDAPPTVLEHEIVLRDIGRIRDVICDTDGSILLLTNGPDRVIRLINAD